MEEGGFDNTDGDNDDDDDDDDDDDVNEIFSTISSIRKTKMVITMNAKK